MLISQLRCSVLRNECDSNSKLMTDKPNEQDPESDEPKRELPSPPRPTEELPPAPSHPLTAGPTTPSIHTLQPADANLGEPGNNEEERLDEALQETMPTSDPVSLKIA